MRKRAVVVGGGIAGLAVARALASDRAVVVCEREAFVGTHSSARNAQIWLPVDDDETTGPLARRSASGWAARLGRGWLRPRRAVVVTDARGAPSVLAGADKGGVSARVIDEGARRRFAPEIERAEVAIAVEGAGTFEPSEMMGALLADCRDRGARRGPDRHRRGARRDSIGPRRRRARRRRARLAADEVVLAAGAWAGALGAAIGAPTTPHAVTAGTSSCSTPQPSPSMVWSFEPGREVYWRAESGGSSRALRRGPDGPVLAVARPEAPEWLVADRSGTTPFARRGAGPHGVGVPPHLPDDCELVSAPTCGPRLARRPRGPRDDRRPRGGRALRRGHARRRGRDPRAAGSLRVCRLRSGHGGPHGGPMKDTPLVHRARELARLAHADQVRKAGNLPYFSHLDAVARLLVAHGHRDEAQIAAAYLHDLLEDQPEYADQMRAEMPVEVIAIVEVLTEPKLDLIGRKRAKRERFKDYVSQISADHEHARAAVPVSCADKVHNLTSIVEAHAQGDNLLGRLRTRPGEHAHHVATLRPIYAQHASPSLLEAFDEVTARLEETILKWLPGRAVMIAAEAHLGQHDKGGAPYIEHPLRLMLKAETREEKMVAVLHDVIEDSTWTLDALAREGFSERVIEALDKLTRRSAETYEGFIERIAEDPLARRVKLLDLEDNSDLSRIAAPTDHDRARVDKYRRAITRLREK
ncbi:MAG: FAD-dependent oxidoreductase [Sandaracinaceae bacterium]